MSGKIGLLRIDDRLVHGQVVTKWVQESSAKAIIIVDDFLSTNAYLSNVFKMAAPQGIDVMTFSAEEFVERYNNNEFDETLLLLFKSVDTLYKVYNLGFHTKKVQIGGVGAGAGRKLIYHTVALSKEEIEKLIEIEKKDTEVYFQRVPDDRVQSLTAIAHKHFKNLS